MALSATASFDMEASLAALLSTLSSASDPNGGESAIPFH
jgi:hypothetical protein